jgi:hypothetical protein
LPSVKVLESPKAMLIAKSNEHLKEWNFEGKKAEENQKLKSCPRQRFLNLLDIAKSNAHL